MKSILFIAFLAIAAVGCDTPESTTGTESAPPMTDSTATDSSRATTPTDTVTSTPVDTTSTLPVDTSTTK